MSEYIFVLSDGVEIPIVIESHRGMRNITLRPKTRPELEIHISKPPLVSNRAAIRFVEQKRKWIESIFARAPKKVKLMPGDTIVIFDMRVFLTHDSSRRANSFRVGEFENAELIVGGASEMFERRVRDFVKKQFLVTVKEMIKMTPREYWPRKIAVHDTVSRWGSCSTSGTMSFSWRLAFAPREVMRYVVMHELAHTKHMDHSPAFWAEVSKLYGFGIERAKRWLSKNGGELHKYF